MSGFAGRPRKGCHACGKFVMGLDEARAKMRHAANKFAKNPTTANREAAARDKRYLDEAKRLHDEHMAEHMAEHDDKDD